MDSLTRNWHTYWGQVSGNNLQVKITGAADVLTVVNWYTATANRVETIALTDGTTINAGTAAPLSLANLGGTRQVAQIRVPNIQPSRARAGATFLDGDSMGNHLVHAMAQFGDLEPASETLGRTRHPDHLRIDLVSPM